MGALPGVFLGSRPCALWGRGRASPWAVRRCQRYCGMALGVRRCGRRLPAARILAGAPDRPFAVAGGQIPTCGRQARPGPRDAAIRGVLPPVRLSCPRGGFSPAVRSWPDYPVVARLPCAGNRGALGAQRATSARRPNLRSGALFFYPAGPDYPVMVWPTLPARAGATPCLARSVATLRQLPRRS